MKSIYLRSVVLLLLVVLFLLANFQRHRAGDYLITHDLWIALGLIGVWATCASWTPRVRLPGRAPGAVAVMATAAAVCALLWAGTHVLMYDYPLTRDEHMVVFDGATFAAGKLAERLPEMWAGFGEALVPAFLIETEGSVLLVSSYLPVNAAARGFFGLVADPALMNPLLVAAGFVLLWRIARRLLPDDPPAQWLALAGYVFSAQVLVTGMTAYAMTGHLALNLLWLALFLRDRWWSHCLAMAVGVLAMGLHQFVFHPLFAGPFVLWLLVQRRWALVLGYGAAYAAGLVLWLAWLGIVTDWGGVPPEASEQSSIIGVIENRVLPVIAGFPLSDLQFIFYNIVRGLAWNAAFILPFMLALAPALKRRDPVVLALLGGCVLTLVAMAVLLPFQGHGWGYRYIHGLIGSLALLAACGYRELAALDRARADGAAVAMLAFSALIIVPAGLWSAHSYTRPHVALTRIVEAKQADFVVIDDLVYRNAVDQVRNRADLSNRPLVFSRMKMGDDKLRILCERGSVAVVGAQDIAVAGMTVPALEMFSPLPPDPCQAAGKRNARR